MVLGVLGAKSPGKGRNGGKTWDRVLGVLRLGALVVLHFLVVFWSFLLAFQGFPVVLNGAFRGMGDLGIRRGGLS